MSRDDFRPTASPQNLKLRAHTLKRLRSFFDARGFVEVETPVLSHDTVIDRHIDPIPVTLFDDPRDVAQGRTLYLQTSPEFGMKRLLAGGAVTAIYQITRAFRGAEQGSHHNPEFSMLEWYSVGDDYHEGMELLAELAKALFRTTEVERLSWREAFLQHAGVDPHAHPHNDERELELDMVLTSKVQPQLGRSTPTIVYDYPATQSALARTRETEHGHVAERFELFYQGVELANGYHELLDPAALRERNRMSNLARQRDGKAALPEESRLLSAMDHGLPACAGCALGVDRLVMLLAGASSLHEVMAFPIHRA